MKDPKDNAEKLSKKLLRLQKIALIITGVSIVLGLGWICTKIPLILYCASGVGVVSLWFWYEIIMGWSTIKAVRFVNTYEMAKYSNDLLTLIKDLVKLKTLNETNLRRDDNLKTLIDSIESKEVKELERKTLKNRGYTNYAYEENNEESRGINDLLES